MPLYWRRPGSSSLRGKVTVPQLSDMMWIVVTDALSSNPASCFNHDYYGWVSLVPAPAWSFTSALLDAVAVETSHGRNQTLLISVQTVFPQG
ncbi:unnamed protein product [Lota lota]